MYKTSQDYKRLVELLEAGEMVVGPNGERFSKDGERFYFSTANHLSWTIDEQKFIDGCAESGAEFIDPSSQEQPQVWHAPEEKPDEDTECIFIKKNGAAILAVRMDEYNLWSGGWPAGDMDDIIKWAYVHDLESMR